MRRPPRPHDLRQPTGPLLTPGELAVTLGLRDAGFIRSEIRAGELQAIRPFRSRKKAEWRIPWAEARAYARRLGLLPG